MLVYGTRGLLDYHPYGYIWQGRDYVWLARRTLVYLYVWDECTAIYYGTNKSWTSLHTLLGEIFNKMEGDI